MISHPSTHASTQARTPRLAPGAHVLTRRRRGRARTEPIGAALHCPPLGPASTRQAGSTARSGAEPPRRAQLESREGVRQRRNKASTRQAGSTARSESRIGISPKCGRLNSAFASVKFLDARPSGEPGEDPQAGSNIEIRVSRISIHQRALQSFPRRSALWRAGERPAAAAA